MLFPRVLSCCSSRQSFPEIQWVFLIPAMNSTPGMGIISGLGCMYWCSDLIRLLTMGYLRIRMSVTANELCSNRWWSSSMEAVSLLTVPALQHCGRLGNRRDLVLFNLSLVQNHAVTLGGVSRMCVTGPARGDRRNSITAVLLCAVGKLLPCIFTKLLLSNERTFENISF